MSQNCYPKISMLFKQVRVNKTMVSVWIPVSSFNKFQDCPLESVLKVQIQKDYFWHNFSSITTQIKLEGSRFIQMGDSRWLEKWARRKIIWVVNFVLPPPEKKIRARKSLLTWFFGNISKRFKVIRVAIQHLTIQNSFDVLVQGRPFVLKDR